MLALNYHGISPTISPNPTAIGGQNADKYRAQIKYRGSISPTLS
ncbi:hypothetical protein [Candidatus Venteria ishoeyi]|nr:hypothetical protein [Candidatus Venteria ishoeyi]